MGIIPQGIDITQPDPDSPGSDAYKGGSLNMAYVDAHIKRAMAPRATQTEKDRLLRLVPDMYAELAYNRKLIAEMVKEGGAANA